MTRPAKAPGPTKAVAPAKARKAAKTSAPPNARKTTKTAKTAAPVTTTAAEDEFRGLPIRAFERQEAWRDWLHSNHLTSPGFWMRFAKKGTPLVTISYAMAVEEALCFGWIDGQAHAHDAVSWLQRFTPRGKKSIWSKINRQKALDLIDRGKMMPAGLQAIESARRDGRWEAAYDSPKTATVPPDLQAALDASPAGKAFFATLNGSNRYAILFRVHNAKKAETRAKLIARFVSMLEAGEKVHP